MRFLILCFSILVGTVQLSIAQNFLTIKNDISRSNERGLELKVRDVMINYLTTNNKLKLIELNAYIDSDSKLTKKFSAKEKVLLAFCHLPTNMAAYILALSNDGEFQMVDDNLKKKKASLIALHNYVFVQNSTYNILKNQQLEAEELDFISLWLKELQVDYAQSYDLDKYMINKAELTQLVNKYKLNYPKSIYLNCLQKDLHNYINE